AQRGEVLGAVRAPGQVHFEPATIGAGQRALKVVRDQPDRLLAYHVAPAQLEFREHHGLPNSVSMIWRRRLRPRCSSTRWLPSLISSTLHTSSLLSPSTSRSVTTSRWRAGSPSMADRIRSAILTATSRSSASSTPRSGGD